MASTSSPSLDRTLTVVHIGAHPFLPPDYHIGCRMIVEHIKLTDFRGITFLEIPFDKRLTVIVGKNGAGKTSFLDALAILLCGFRNLWRTPQHGVSAISPERSDIAYSKSGYTLEATVVAEDEKKQKFTQQLCLGSDGRQNNRVLQNLFNSQTPHDEPLFVYYRQDRNFHTKGGSRQQYINSQEQIRQHSLLPDLRAISDLNVWMDKLDAQEARRHRDMEKGYRDPRLEAIRSLIREIEEFERIGFDADRENHGLYIDKSDGTRVYVDQLSSGERVYLILLIDLARRLQIIMPNKHIGNIPGIILIDEVELNLHPDWQRKIIPALTDVFRSCQFIVTTHSPQVVGELAGDNIIILSRDDEMSAKWSRFREDTYGRDSNELLVKVLGASERNQEIKTELESLEGLISVGELEQAEKLLGKLRARMGGYVVELEIAEGRLRRRAGNKRA